MILGVAASVAQFCEFANTLTHQIREFVNCVDEAPGVLRDITIQLPLLVKICETFEVDEGDLDTETLCSVLTGCIGHLKEFSDLTDKIRPTATDSKLKRAWKAVKHASHYENKFETFQRTLDSFKTTLNLYCSHEARSYRRRSSVDAPVANLPALSESVARYNLLRAIDAQFESFNDAFVMSKIVVLQGMGGQGKTRLALDYAYRMMGKAMYSHIFWMDASSKKAMIRSYEEVGDRLANGRRAFTDTESKVKFAKEKLQGNPWLLILDNLDDPTEFGMLSKMLPTGKGSVLITSRHEDTLAYGRVVRLDRMEDSEAIELLLRNTLHKGGDPEVRQNAIKIVKKLGGLPLAVDQASAYIQAQKLPLEDFIPHYETMKEKIFNHKRVNWDYFQKLSGDDHGTSSLGILATWEMSFQQIENKNNRREAMEHLLTISSYLGNAAVFERLVKAYQAYSPQDATWCNVFLRDGKWNSSAFRDAIAELSRLSLIEVENYQRECGLKLHPVIRDWLQMRQPANVRVKYLTESTTIVANFINRTSADALQEVYRYVLEHLDACCAHDIAHHGLPGRLGFDGLREPAIVFVKFYSLQGRPRDAERPMENVLEHDKASQGAEHAVTISSARGLAEIYQQLARYSDAETLLSSALAAVKGAAKQDELETLRLYSSLGNINKSRDRSAEAEIFFEKALRGFESHPSAVDEDILTCIENLAEVKRHLKKIPDSTKLYARAKMGHEKRLPEYATDSPDLSRVLGKLGDLFRTEGQYELAEQTYLRVLQANRLRFGPDHPSTNLITTNLAICCRNEEKYREAERHFDDAIISFTRSLGPDHPDTLRAIMNKTVCLDKQGHYAAAEVMYRVVLKGRREKLGYAHYTLRTTERLTWMLWKQGKREQAEHLASEIGILAKLTTTEELQKTKSDVIKYPALECLYRKAVERHLGKYRWDHVDCVENYECLSELCMMHGNYRECHELREKIVKAEANERATREKARLAAREWEGWLYTDSMTGKARPTAEVIDQPLYLLDPDTGQYLAGGHDPEKARLAAMYGTTLAGHPPTATTAAKEHTHASSHTSSSHLDPSALEIGLGLRRRSFGSNPDLLPPLLPPPGTPPPPPAYNDIPIPAAVKLDPALAGKKKRQYLGVIAEQFGLNTPAGMLLVLLVVFGLGYSCATGFAMPSHLTKVLAETVTVTATGQQTPIPIPISVGGRGDGGV